MHTSQVRVAPVSIKNNNDNDALLVELLQGLLALGKSSLLAFGKIWGLRMNVRFFSMVLIVIVLFCQFAQANDAQMLFGEWLSRDRLYLMQLFPDGKIYFFGRKPGAPFQMTLGANCSNFTKEGGMYENTFTTYSSPFYPKGATAHEKLTFAFIDRSTLETAFYRVPTNQLIDSTTWQPSARDACKRFVDTAKKAHDEFLRMDEDPKVMAQRHAIEDELFRLQKEAGDFGDKETYEMAAETIKLLATGGRDILDFSLKLSELLDRLGELIGTYRSAKLLIPRTNAYAKMYQNQYDIIHEMRANVDTYACLDFDKRYNIYPNSELLLPEYLIYDE